MKHKLLIFEVVAMIVLASCNNQQKIENWESVRFKSVGAQFLKLPARFIEFNGPYADGEKHDQNHKYLELCIKGLVKYADNVHERATCMVGFFPPHIYRHYK